MKFLYYLLTIDIYAEACHTTAIFYQLATWFTKRYAHGTCCLVASLDPFLSSPTCEFSVKGKEVLWVCLVAPGISCLFFFFSFVVAAFSICVAI